LKDLTTSRLLLRKIEVSDALFIFKLLNSEGWLTYIGDRNIKTLIDAEKQITERFLQSYKDNGFGSYLVLDTLRNEPIGTCGIYKRPNLAHPDIGFAFLPEHFGKGYGYESATAVLDYSREVLGIKTVLAMTLPHNLPSIKLLEKLGLFKVGNYTFEGETEELLLFST
jgi:RimJ/RimL family protein N-acetyltransferase